MRETINVESLTRWIREFARAIEDNRDLLTELDLAIGDGDHGINMDRGLAAVASVMDEQRPSHVAVLLRDVVARTLMSAVGGASGVLYAEFFRGMADSAGQAESLDGLAFARALRAGLDWVVRRGHAEVGDKTMVDVLAPTTRVLDIALAEGAGLDEALRKATVSAEDGRDATEHMRARKGRASYFGERAVGHVDPGATSAALLIAAAATAFGDVP